jgi:hypothetical protein
MVLIMYIKFQVSDNDWEAISNIDMIHLTNDLKKFYYKMIVTDFLKEFNTNYASCLVSNTCKNKVKYGSLKLVYERYHESLIKVFYDTTRKVSIKYYLFEPLISYYHLQWDLNPRPIA